MSRYSHDLNAFVSGDTISPLAASARSLDGDSGWLNAERYNTLVLSLAVTAKTGVTPTLDCSVFTAQDSSGTGSTSLVAFTQASDVTAQQKIVTGLDKYFKVTWLIKHDGGTEAAVAASGTLTSNNTNVTAGTDTVTIGTKVYTFQTVATVEGDVTRGASADASLLNLIRAINHTGTPGVDYVCAAAHPSVTAASSVTSHAFAVTAKVAGAAGNSIATTKSAATLSWGAGDLAGGEDAATFTFGVTGYAK